MDALDELHASQTLDHSMNLTRAARILDGIDPDTPWRSVSDWVEALAAHSAVHRSEIGRRSHAAGVPLRRLICNAARPTRAQWLFNNLRLLHDLPRNARSLVASGTTANEAFHAEINTWTRNAGEVYRETVELQMSIAVLGKLLSHTSALARPTLRQLRPAEILARQVAVLRIPPESWLRHCEVGSQGGASLTRARLPLQLSRGRLRRRLWSWARTRPSEQLKKRPAGHALMNRHRPRGVPSKRTAFTTLRSGTLVPPALRRAKMRVRFIEKTSARDPRWFGAGRRGGNSRA